MGAECTASEQEHPDYSLLAEFNYAALGKVQHLRNSKTGCEILAKRMTLKGLNQIEAFKQSLADSNDYGHLPTVLTLKDYQFEDQTNSKSNYEHPSHILLSWEYFPESSCLASQIEIKRKELKRYKSQPSNQNVMKEVLKVKMSDYQRIDNLKSDARRIINTYYQQIEVLRMMDHVVGAALLLSHFGRPHLAIRPETIIIDSDGKHILADRELLQQPTNYSLSQKEIKDKSPCSQSIKALQYLPKEAIKSLQSVNSFSDATQSTLDLYSIGVIAIQMCLLREINFVKFQQSSNGYQCTYQANQLAKALTQIKYRYSDEMVSLLESAVHSNPSKRSSFTSFIDELSSLLEKNVACLQKVFSNCQEAKRPSISSLTAHTAKNSPMKPAKKGKEDSIQLGMPNLSKNQKSIVESETDILSQLDSIKTNLIGNRQKEEGINSNKLSASASLTQINSRQLYEMYLLEYSRIKKNTQSKRVEQVK